MGRRSVKWIFWILLLGIVLTCIFHVDTLIDRAVKKSVSFAVNAINAKKELLVTINEVDMDATNGIIYLRGINVVPDSPYYDNFKNDLTDKQMLTEFQIDEIALSNINLKTIFWDKRIDSANISIKHFISNVYLSHRKDDASPSSSKSNTRFVDSLHLKGLHHIDLAKITVNRYQLNVLHADTKDTISSISGDYLEIDGVDLEERQNESQVFTLRTDNLAMYLKNQRLKLANKDYEIALGSLEFNKAEQLLRLTDVKYSPVKSLEYLASKKKYADNLFDVQFKNIAVDGLDIDAYQENHLVSINKIAVAGMDLKIFKNKQKPEYTLKRPLLPQQALETMGFPVHIDEILLNNSSLTYKEVQPGNAKEIMTVNLTNVNTQVRFVTSIKDSLASGKPLTVALNSKLLGKTKMNINITMPYNRHDNSFGYSGNVGSADLTIFNTLLIPSANIAIKTGRLERIHFSVKATPSQANGELTMLYSNLHVDIPRKNKKVEHALSFLASSAIHKLNPKKNGKERVALVYYNRPMHKGFGGFITKSVLSGIINSIQPLGKHKKEVKTEKRLKTRKKGRTNRRKKRA